MDVIRDWWKYSSVRDLYYNVKNGVRNLYVYFPLIWTTRDWDSYYIYDFLQFKIKRHREYIDSRARHVGYEKSVKKMRTAELLIERLKEDDYVYCKSDWSGEGMRVHYYHPLAPKRSDERDFQWVFELESRRKTQDKELLYKILSRNIDKWWD